LNEEEKEMGRMLHLNGTVSPVLIAPEHIEAIVQGMDAHGHPDGLLSGVRTVSGGLFPVVEKAEEIERLRAEALELSWKPFEPKRIPPSVEANKSEFRITLTGPASCGKTTLLNDLGRIGYLLERVPTLCPGVAEANVLAHMDVPESQIEDVRTHGRKP
jgi:hypothetical protein